MKSDGRVKLSMLATGRQYKRERLVRRIGRQAGRPACWLADDDGDAQAQSVTVAFSMAMAPAASVSVMDDTLSSPVAVLNPLPSYRPVGPFILLCLGSCASFIHALGGSSMEHSLCCRKGKTYIYTILILCIYLYIKNVQFTVVLKLSLAGLHRRLQLWLL